MLNGNKGQLPQPQPRVPLLEGVPQGGQTRVMVEEPFEAVMMSEATFDGLRIFAHAQHYEWCLEVYV